MLKKLLVGFLFVAGSLHAAGVRAAEGRIDEVFVLWGQRPGSVFITTQNVRSKLGFFGTLHRDFFNEWTLETEIVVNGQRYMISSCPLASEDNRTGVVVTYDVHTSSPMGGDSQSNVFSKSVPLHALQSSKFKKQLETTSGGVYTHDHIREKFKLDPRYKKVLNLMR